MTKERSSFYCAGVEHALCKLGSMRVPVYRSETWQRRTGPMPQSPTTANIASDWNDFDSRFKKNVTAPETTRYGE